MNTKKQHDDSGSPAVRAGRLLDGSDVAARLNCSRSHAYALMRTMPHLALGPRMIRVSEADFAACKIDRSVLAPPAPALRENSTTLKPRILPPDDGSENEPVRITMPRTKPRLVK